LGCSRISTKSSIDSGNATIGGIEQTFDTVPGQKYQVAFDLAGNYGGLPVVKPLQVMVAGQTHNYTFDTTGAGQFDMKWTTKTFTFVALSSGSTISFVSDTTGLGGIGNAGAALDNVRITPAPNDAPALGMRSLLLVAALLLVCGSGLARRKAGALRGS